eukprot:862812_1
MSNHRGKEDDLDQKGKDLMGKKKPIMNEKEEDFMGKRRRCGNIQGGFNMDLATFEVDLKEGQNTSKASSPPKQEPKRRHHRKTTVFCFVFCNVMCLFLRFCVIRCEFALFDHTIRSVCCFW